MARIEDYALIGDLHSAALVDRTGSIDWLCLPRFDSPACFAALLDSERAGCWQLGPVGDPIDTSRRYLPDTLVLETIHTTVDGQIRVLDLMPPRATVPHVVRIVEGVRGRVRVRSSLRLRFDDGHVIPWVRHEGHSMSAVAGPDSAYMTAGVRLRGQDWATVGDVAVGPGDRVPFVLTWAPSHEPRPAPVDAFAALDDTVAYWQRWTQRSRVHGTYREPVQRSLITGYTEEAVAWREWLLRAVAGDPADLQVVYGVDGRRRLPESELAWLAGYEGSQPVRTGNAATGQLQLDVWGEVLDGLSLARRAFEDPRDDSWEIQTALLDHLEGAWREPDNGLWEMRGPRQHFTYSKVMAWVAADRMVDGARRYGLPGPARRWAAMRAEIRADVLAHGFDAARNTFVQAYGGTALDASLLLIPRVGFLPYDDPRALGTLAAVERDLVVDGLVLRYRTSTVDDGLPPGEGMFLACSFWLVDALVGVGRRREATELFERLLTLRNDVGLLSEEWDPRARRHLGNTPQAFSHFPLVMSALSLQGGIVHRSDHPADAGDPAHRYQAPAAT
ncbi:glycoside hydrolase family 15 protein [Cellulomonas sp. KRMCY2]|uniref:glycoside hydrolase family 15 protein n=1 Tax=Cellulomonas sp. KRMCY2 TaxID=1304865 RepID=UPI00045EBCB5|nr:glycoside hydrolase family 15 protein [Cellulomonas sp. KRMCY2]